MHEPVFLPLQRHHFFLGFLAFGRGQLQQGDVGVLLADGRQQRLLPERGRQTETGGQKRKANTCTDGPVLICPACFTVTNQAGGRALGAPLTSAAAACVHMQMSPLNVLLAEAPKEEAEIPQGRRQTSLKWSAKCCLLVLATA